MDKHIKFSSLFKYSFKIYSLAMKSALIHYAENYVLIQKTLKPVHENSSNHRVI